MQKKSNKSNNADIPLEPNKCSGDRKASKVSEFAVNPSCVINTPKQANCTESDQVPLKINESYITTKLKQENKYVADDIPLKVNESYATNTPMKPNECYGSVADDIPLAVNESYATNAPMKSNECYGSVADANVYSEINDKPKEVFYDYVTVQK